MKIDLDLTRKEFIDERVRGMFCPHYFNLKSEFNSSNCNGKLTCKECWKNSVKDLKFRGEA